MFLFFFFFCKSDLLTGEVADPRSTFPSLGTAPSADPPLGTTHEVAHFPSKVGAPCLKSSNVQIIFSLRVYYSSSRGTYTYSPQSA